MKDKIVDYLGNEIQEGMKALRVADKYFSQCEIVNVVDKWKIGIRSGRNAKVGYTYANRLIVDAGFTNELR